jgi:hypothetical protein
MSHTAYSELTSRSKPPPSDGCYIFSVKKFAKGATTGDLMVADLKGLWNFDYFWSSEMISSHPDRYY